LPSLTATEAKQIVLSRGADLCGIAPVGRFSEAPEGFHPLDVFSECSSVLVFARRMPSGPLFAESPIPYTHVCDVLIGELDRIGLAAAVELESRGVRAVGIPADDPSDYWEADRSYARGALSMRHAGHLAGLGVLGRNTLLKNPVLGNMFQIGALLVAAPLEGDPVDESEPCPAECRACLDACPQGALDGKTVDQALCRPLSNYVNQRGFKLYKCWRCRKACPEALGKRA
jgi:epoxyqueuosine reductase